MRTLKFDKPNVKPTFTIRKLTEEEKIEIYKEPESPTVYFKGGNKRRGRAGKARETQNNRHLRSAFPDGFYGSGGHRPSSDSPQFSIGNRIQEPSDSNSGGTGRLEALAKANQLFSPKESNPSKDCDREGAAIVKRNSSCKECNHPFSSHYEDGGFHSCVWSTDAKPCGCRCFTPGEK